VPPTEAALREVRVVALTLGSTPPRQFVEDMMQQAEDKMLAMGIEPPVGPMRQNRP
jgi:hypothetical protein